MDPKAIDELVESADIVLVAIERADVEAGRIDPVLGVLRSFVENPIRIKKLQGRVALSVSGYESDPRELADIAEVRSFMARLDAAFPYWFYFLSPKLNGLGFITFCLCPNQRLDGARQMEPAAVEQFLMSHFGALNEFCDSHGISEKENRRISDEIFSFFGG